MLTGRNLMASTSGMSQEERDEVAERCNSVFLNEDSLDCALLAAGKSHYSAVGNVLAAVGVLCVLVVVVFSAATCVLAIAGVLLTSLLWVFPSVFGCCCCRHPLMFSSCTSVGPAFAVVRYLLLASMLLLYSPLLMLVSFMLLASHSC